MAEGIAEFMRQRTAHMLAEMERRGLEVPDPRDMLPDDWQSLPDDYKRALYNDTWATVGANIAYYNDQAHMPGWAQDPLPLAEFADLFRAADGWCAPPPEG